MTKVPLTLANLQNLDHGIINAAFAHELGILVADMHDRPTTKKTRTLNIEISLSPIAEVRGNLVELTNVNVDVVIKSSMPKRQTKTYNMKPSAGNNKALEFQPESAENPDQETMDFPEQSGKRVDPTTGEETD
jgi:hypothetical protein